VHKSEVPDEILELIEQADNNSNEAFVGAYESCYGVEVENMSIRHLMMLDGIETPFLKGGSITDSDIALFLWIVSPDFNLSGKGKKEFFKKAVKLKTIPCVNWIRDYMKRTFQDADTMNQGEKGQVYFITYFVDVFAREYSWGYNEIMDLPLRVAFQLITSINERNSRKSGEKYTRVTELDNTINRCILNSKSSNGI
jgi:hypothetical protein